VGFLFGFWCDMFTAEENKVLQSVALQLMTGDEVVLEDGRKVRVKRVGSGRLRMVEFRMGGRVFEAIEQNATKPSRWGQLARQGHQVVQFRDLATRKYVAVAVDGEITEYGRG
jgi:hypothetical protein